MVAGTKLDFTINWTSGPGTGKSWHFTGDIDGQGWHVALLLHLTAPQAGAATNSSAASKKTRRRPPQNALQVR